MYFNLPPTIAARRRDRKFKSRENTPRVSLKGRLKFKIRLKEILAISSRSILYVDRKAFYLIRSLLSPRPRGSSFPLLYVSRYKPQRESSRLMKVDEYKTGNVMYILGQTSCRS